MTTEIRRRPSPDTSGLPDSIPPLLRRIYAARGIQNNSDLDKGLKGLPKPDLLRGMKEAVQLLVEAVTEQKRIVIVADFDADGATSCALGIRALQAMGAENVGYIVPNRFEYGYGLTPEIVELARESNPDLLITVDNGISSIEGVEAARDAGVKVLVTDHHLPGRTLPAADAIVNPNQGGCDFPSGNIAGVGVIFYVMLALRAALREQNWFTKSQIVEPNLASLLDLVAFGTVADVVPLDHLNRTLVEQGLRRIRAGQCVPGIRALAEVAGKNLKRFAASDIGFGLGPRLNAAGRLEDMSYGIECLLTEDIEQAREMARSLDDLNQERRNIEGDMQAQALLELERLELSESDMPTGLCLFDEDWHQGVIGILASRIRERTHRPVIAFAPDKDGMIKGSARSVPGFHIRDALDAVATQHPGLINKFGGHAMAAGLGLPQANLGDFKQAFDTETRKHLKDEDLRGIILSDGELSATEINLNIAETLRDAGPWGQAFPEPSFDGEFELLNCRVLKDKHLKMTVRVPDTDYSVDAIAFNQYETHGKPKNQRLRLAYRLDVNEWRGERQVQLMVEHIEML